MPCFFRNIRAFEIQTDDRAKDLLWLTQETHNYNAFALMLGTDRFLHHKPLCMADIQYQNNKTMEKHILLSSFKFHLRYYKRIKQS